MPIIEAKEINFSYGGNVVLDHVSFTVEKGDYVGIVGPNGGGKTTLLKVLIGLFKPSSGTAFINGIPVNQFKDKSKIGYVPQRISQENLSFPATVYEVVKSALLANSGIFSRPDKLNEKSIYDALTISGILDLKNSLLSSLSGGQRQRVYVARALAQNPEILFLDEPFVGVDVATQKDFYAFLKTLNQQRGLTILFVSHDIDVITDEVKSILCLNRGLLCLDSPKALHEPNVIENLYGKKIMHIHHSH